MIPVRPRLFALVLAGAVATAGPVATQTPTVTGESFECLIEPHSVINLGSAVEGVLAEVGVGRGDLVTPDQVIARLESGVEEAIAETARERANADVNVRASQARMNYQARRLKRSEELHRKKVIALSAIDENRTEKRLAELELQEARLNLKLAKLEHKRALEILDQREIRSPISGIVVDRFLSAGEYVHKQAPLMKLARIDLLKVEAFMPVMLYGQVRVGMQAELRPQEPIGGRYTAKVTVVDRVLDAASGTFRIRLELPNEDLKLPAGIRCQLSFLQG